MVMEKAIPEWKIVKEEILKSYYNAVDQFADYNRGRERGHNNLTSMLNTKKHIMETYLKLRMKIMKEKVPKNYKYMLVLDKHFNGENKLSDKTWIKCLFLLGEFIEWLGISKVEKFEFEEDEAMA